MRPTSLISPILLLFKLLVPLYALAQASVGGGSSGSTGFGTVKAFTASSPEMANFQRYGDVPVNYNTGVPDIRLPLGELTLTGFSWPVSLSYYAGGHKVADIASNVGLGWTLQAGGSVSAKVLGLSDIYGEPLIERFLQLGSRAPFIDKNCAEMPSYYYSEIDMAEATGLASTEQSQPDIFYLNLPTANERFFLGPGGVGYSVPISDNRIKLESNGSQYSFTMVDKQGNRYTFGLMGNSTSAGGCSSGGGAPYNPSFALTRVDTYLGEHLTFSYDPITYSYETIGMETEQRFLDQPPAAECSLPAQQKCLSTTTATEFRLKSITSSRGQVVTIEYSTRADFAALPRVSKVTFSQIINNDVTERYRYDLQHSYFGTTQQNNLRLRLDRLTKQSADAQPEVHEFEYDPTELPHRLSTSFDYYGFANGTNGAWTAASTILPSKTNRVPSFQYTKASVLTRIKYPLHGATRFVYELNAGNWGGLRVKSIQDEDISGAVVRRRSFAYTDPPGIGTPNFTQYPSTFYLKMPADKSITSASNAQLATCSYILEQSSPTVENAWEYMAGSLSYGEVTELFDDYSENIVGKHGKIVYRYDTHLNAQGRETIVPFPAMLTEKHVFKREGENYVLVQSSESFYEVTPDPVTVRPDGSHPDFYYSSPVNMRETRLRFKVVRLLRDELGYTGTDLSQICYAKEFAQMDFSYDVAALYLKRTVEQNFLDDGRTFTSQTDYEYNTAQGELSPSRVTRTGSDGVAEVQELRYSGSDLSGLGYTADEQAAMASLAGHNVVVPVWQRHLKGISPVFENQVFYSQEWGKPLPKKEVVRPGGGGAQRQTVINRYVGNLAVEVEQQDQPTEAYRFNSRKEITAVCQNASYDDFAFASFNDAYETGFSYTTLGTAFDLDAYASGVSYRLSSGAVTKANTKAGNEYVIAGFFKGGAVSVSGAQLLSETVPADMGNGWFYFEKRVEALGTSVTISGGGLLDELRFMPAKAVMKTYSYRDFLGQVSSVTDANGQTTFFHYDTLGRLVKTANGRGEILKTYEYHVRK